MVWSGIVVMVPSAVVIVTPVETMGAQDEAMEVIGSSSGIKCRSYSIPQLTVEWGLHDTE